MGYLDERHKKDLAEFEAAQERDRKFSLKIKQEAEAPIHSAAELLLLHGKMKYAVTMGRHVEGIRQNYQRNPWTGGDAPLVDVKATKPDYEGIIQNVWNYKNTGNAVRPNFELMGTNPADITRQIPDLTTGGLGPLMTPYPSPADVKLTQWGSTGPGGGSSAGFGGKMSNLYPDHVNLVNTKLREFGMEDGVFRYDTFVGKVRKAADGTPPSIGRTESREFVEFFQTVKQMAEDFKGIRDKGRHVEFKSRWVDFLKDKGMKASNIQLHHVDTLYDSLPLYDGIKFDSDEWWDLTATLLNNNVRPGTTFHKGKSNLLSVIGYSNQWGTGLTDATPHGVAHLYYADKLKDFFTPEVMNKIRTVPGYRLDVAQDFSEIVNKSEDIVEQAMKTWEAMNPKGNMGFDELVEFLGKLDNNGLLDTNKIAGKYQVPQLRDLITSITEEIDSLPRQIFENDEAFEGWLLNLLVDKKISNKVFNPIQRKIKKRYGK